MIKKMLGRGATISVLTLTACGGNVQEIGDAVSGNGGSATTHAGSGAAQPHAGNASNASGGASSQLGGSSNSALDGRGGAAWAPGTCDPPCREGFGCYPVEGNPAGLCAPLCEMQDQGQTPDTDLSCTNSVRGGAGQCVDSLGFGWPNPGAALSAYTGTGLCSNPCDPLAQDCPTGYKCDQAYAYSAVVYRAMYACVPEKEPRALDEACDGEGDGRCAAGLSCTTPDVNQAAMRCASFCDMRDPSTCPTGQTCTETVVSERDNDPNIGLCL
jgi:hypothetical protein